MLSDLVELPGGVFSIGSERFYPDEGPVHDERVKPLAIEQHPVTNAQFSEFVDDTGYVTVAGHSSRRCFLILRLKSWSQALWC